MKRVLPFVALLLLLLPCAHARLGETIAEIQARYGKTLKGVKPEYPATVAGVYAKPGFQIVVGFHQGKSYYEQIYKLDPQKPKALAEISQEEQVILLKANCSGCDWKGQPTTTMQVFPPVTYTNTTYDRSDGLAKAVYDGRTKVLTIRLLEVEKADEAKRKAKEQADAQKARENLKGF